jgi:hypothetical protein
LLFWPFSAVWAIPQAYQDTDWVNEQDTLYYYELGPGKDQLAAAKANRPAAPDPPSPP